MKDPEGAYFIDRDGKIFEIILNFLRTGNLVVPAKVSIDVLYNECDFYGITPMLTAIEKSQSDACGGKFLKSIIEYDDSKLSKGTEDVPFSPTISKTSVTFIELQLTVSRWCT